MTDITFKQLKKWAKADASAFPQYKLAVMASATTPD